MGPPGHGLIKISLPGSAILKAEELARRYPHPGRIDLISLVLAMEEKAMLLTGDEALRKAAFQEGVEVHGRYGFWMRWWSLERFQE